MDLRLSRRALARCLCAALLLAGAPGVGRGAEGLDDVTELARTLTTDGERPAEPVVRLAAATGRTYPVEVPAPAGRLAAVTGRAYRVEVPASAGRYDRRAGVFHVQLLTAEERILAAMRVDHRGAYMARTREGLQFLIRREDVTVYELEPVEGIELARDIPIPAAKEAARALWDGGLVAVCEFRVVAGSDGLAEQRSVESRQTSMELPLDGTVTTHVIRVALESVTLRRGSSGLLDLHTEEPPPRPSRTAPPRGE